MNPETWTTTDLILANLERVAITFWRHMGEAAWQATALAVLVLLVVTLGRKWPSPLRYGLLLIALLKFAIPPALPAPAGLFPWFEQNVELEAWTVPIVLAERGRLAVSSEAASLGATSSEATRATSRPNVIVWLFGIYGLGALAMAIRLGLGYRHLSRLAASARVADDPALLALHVDMCQQLGLRRCPRLLIADDPSASPMAFGTWRQEVLLPRHAVRDLETEALRAVLAHELAHHARGDLWVVAMQNLLSVVWWFHPFYHLLARHIRGIREDCCDDMLLARGLVRDRGYCAAILDAADLVTTPVPAAGLGFAERLHPLSRRLRRILDRDLVRAPRLSAFSAAVLITFAMGALPGRLLGGPLGDEVTRIETQLEHLAEYDLARLWPLFVLDQVAEAENPKVRLERLVFSQDSFEIKGNADRTHDLAVWTESMVEPHPMFEFNFRSVTAAGNGTYFFHSHQTFDWQALASVLPEKKRDVSTRTRELQNLRDAKMEELSTHEPDQLGATVRAVREILEQPPSHLQKLTPGPLLDRGPFVEWPIRLVVLGSLDEMRQILGLLVLKPDLSFYSLQLDLLEDEKVQMDAEVVVLFRAPGDGELNVTLGERRFSGDLDQLLRAVSAVSNP